MPDFRTLSLKQLRALLETHRSGTVTGAANALHVTPPAITTQLKLLEKSVGAPLFNRSSDGFVVTDVGSELVAAAVDVETRIERARDRIAALKAGAVGSVILGVVSTGKYFAPAIVAAFGKAHPGIRVTLAIGNRGKIIHGVEHNEFDLVIMGRPPAHVAVVSDVLCDHPHVLICAPDHELANVEKIATGDLLKERFLAREPGSGTRALMERFIDRIGDGQPCEAVEMGTNETIKQAVIAGLGIAIISAHTCYSELHDGKLVTLPVKGLPLVRQWYLLHRSDHDLTTAAKVLKSFVIEHRLELVPRET